MMYRLVKPLLFLLILVLLDNNILCIKSGLLFSNAYANDESKTIDIKAPQELDAQGKPISGSSTFPSCGVDVILGLTGLITTILVGLPLIGFAIGIGIIIGGIVGAMQLVGCLWSFVRNPVLRTEDGNYKYCKEFVDIDPSNPKKGKYCKNGEYQRCNNASSNEITQEDYAGCVHSWPRNKVAHSEYIEVCYREPIGGLCVNGYEECAKGKLDPREKAFKSINLGVFGDNKSLQDVLNMKAAVGHRLKCKTLKAGETKNIGPYTYLANYEGGELCAYVKFTKKSKIGCQLREPVSPSPMCTSSKANYNNNGKIVSYDNSGCFNCYISEACYSGDAGIFSHAQLSMTSLVVQCIKESLDNLLEGNCAGDKTTEGFLKAAQKRLKSAVQAVIILAIILFGFKLMVGALQGAHEWALFAIKIAFILYFTVYDGMHLYYRQLINLSTGIANIVQKSGGNETICNFEDKDYMQPVRRRKKDGEAPVQFTEEERKCYAKIVAAGNNNNNLILSDFINQNCPGLTDLINKLEFKDFSYLALWDRLDCRLGFYMGQSLVGFGVGGAGAAGSAVVAAAGIAVGALFMLPGIIIALVFTGQIVIAIVSLLYMILLILVIIWITHLFILSIIALTIVVLFSPIFIPMLLFQVTRPFFDGWTKELMSYSLYPVILFAFLSLMLSVFDTLFFEDLEFKREIRRIDGFRAVYGFALKDPDACSQKNVQGETRSSVVLACILQSANFKETQGLFGMQYTSAGFDKASTTTVWKKIGMMALMCFLFYHFLGMLGKLAAELVGNFRNDLSQNVSSPQDMAKKAVSAGIMIGKAIATNGASLAEDAKGAAASKARDAVEGGSNGGSSGKEGGGKG